MKGYLTLNEAVTKYGITAQTIKNWDKQGIIQIHTTGTKIKYIPEEALSQVMASPLPMDELALTECRKKLIVEKQEYAEAIADLKLQRQILSHYEVKKFREMFSIFFECMPTSTALEKR